MSDLFSLAIIPARGGSKRIPRKNIKPFCGKPIIAYSIAAAKEAKCFSDVIISTDDEEIAKVALSFGSNVPFMRSSKNADDRASITDALKEAIITYEEKVGHKVDLVCCILSTAPLITAESIYKGYEKIINSDLDVVLSIVRYDYPIQRAFRLEGQLAKMIWPENYPKHSQELESSYHDAGQFYWIKRDNFLKHEKIFTSQTGFICIDEMRAQDIDTEDDWRCAEAKYKLLQSKW